MILTQKAANRRVLVMMTGLLLFIEFVSSMVMVMVSHLCAHFLCAYSNAFYKLSIYGWDRTSGYKDAAGSRYQSISDLAQPMNE